MNGTSVGRHFSSLLCMAAITCAMPAFGQPVGPPLVPVTDLQLQVKVLPRMGLFDPLYFSSSIALRSNGRGKINHFPVMGGWQPLDEPTYSRYVPEQLRKSLPSEWQLLTYEGLYDSRIIAYSERAVRISLKSKSGIALKNCTLTVPGKQYSPPYANERGALLGPDCEFYFRIDSNLQTPFTIEYEAASDLGQKATYSGVVPEDFLIVSLGDSYASGEGNPDIPKERPSDFASYARGNDNWPIWMDNKCQRSAWAGPIQAALQLIKDEKPGPSSALVTGAYTIVSLACSGGEIQEGILGPHDGPVTYANYLNERLPHGTAQPAYPVEEDPKNWGQVETLLRMLQHQATTGSDNRVRKLTIDTLIVSIGGNDVFFGPLVKTLTLKSMSADDLAKIKPTADLRLERLKETLYPEMITKFRHNLAWTLGPDATAPRIGVRQMLFTEYPDPTGGADGKPCDAKALGGLTGLSEFLSGAGLISGAEATWTKKHIIVNLNGVVKGAADAADAVFVTGISQQFAGRGLCADGSSDPYAPQTRLIRLPLESRSIQGNLNGAVHPTWQGHQAYSKQIYAELQASRTRRLRTQLHDDLEQSNATGFIRSPLRIRVQEQLGDASFAERNGADRWCHTINALDNCNPTQQTEAILLHGATIDLHAHVLHVDTKTIWKQRLGQYIVDAHPPYPLRCDIVSPNNTTGVPCADGTWLTVGAKLRSTASDLDGQNKASGVNFLTATVHATDNSIALQRNTPAGAESFTLADSDLPDGSFRLTVTATDRAGNAGALQKDLRIYVDRKEPVIDSVTAYGVPLKTLKMQDAALPVLRGLEADISVTATDAMWGPRLIALRFEPASGVENKWQRDPSTGICDRFDPASRQTFTALFTSPLVPGNTAYSDGNIAIIAEDCNHNRTREPERYRAVVIRPIESMPLKSRQDWAEKFADNNVPKALAYKLTPLWRNTEASLQSPNGALLAAWLNVAAGLVLPGNEVEALPLPPACGQPPASKKHSVFFALTAAEVCERALTTPVEREKFLSGLQSYFEQQKILAVGN